MSILIWLVGIPGSALAAIAWGVWRSRPRRPADVDESLEAYERFREAIGGEAQPPRR